VDLGDGSRRFRSATAAAVLVALAVAGCGGGSDESSSSSTTSAATGASGVAGATGEQGTGVAPVEVSFQAPRGSQNAFGAGLLKANKLSLIGNAFAQLFQVPETVKIEGVNGFGGGPFFNPKNNTITFQYGFVGLVYQTMSQLHPDWSQYRIGTAVGAVDSFIIAHEYTHALISIYNLPVLGREEDAADELGTLLLLRAQQGPKYVFDAAQFWATLSNRQAQPTLADYADVHSLDLQRSLDMLCELAGSSKDSYRGVASLRILPASRLQGCPAEYQQKVKSFEQVLGPHLQGSLGG
jgi:Putative metallopeptidase